jgi:DNA-directed RNA polymerase subunit RPC12/RpoP
MTMEKRIFLDVKEITGIEYSCAHCGGKFQIPLTKFDRVVGRCPNCEELLVSAMFPESGRRDDRTRIESFVAALKELQSTDLPVKLDISSAMQLASEK